MSDADMAQMKTRLVDRAASKLDLDEAQKAKLAVLADQMQAQRKAFIGNTADPRADLQALVSGATFDRAKAAALIEGKVGAVQTQSPAVVAALADFYDSLKPEQQAKLRSYMDKRGHRG
jgi:Spy/CpxP family protein refolding chaperone